MSGFFLFLKTFKNSATIELVKMNDGKIIEKLKESGLEGRGGAAFPVGLKWEAVRRKEGQKKYVICNAAESEPGVFKDGFLLLNYPAEVVKGIKLGLETTGAVLAYLYLREDYYKKFGGKLKKFIGDLPIRLFKKPSGYLAGEETALLEAIEGRMPLPRKKPPYPTERGLFSCPTLINNVETFYYVSRVAEGKYKETRFYSISGKVKNKGVFELPAHYSVRQILEETNNLPDFDFFVQAGGGAAGKILLPDELEEEPGGSGAVIIFKRKKTDLFVLMKRWLDFFIRNNCDKCVPCREGIFRLAEAINHKKIDRALFEEIFLALQKTSFCNLGKSAGLSLRGFLEKFDFLEQ